MTTDATEMYHQSQDNIDADMENKINAARTQMNSVKEFAARTKDEILGSLENGVPAVPDSGRQTDKSVAREAVLVICERYPEAWFRAQELYFLTSERDHNGHITTPILEEAKPFNDMLWNMAEKNDKVLRRAFRVGTKKAGFYSLASGKLWDASLIRNDRHQITSFANYDDVVAKRMAEIDNAKKMLAKLEKQRPKTATAKETREMQMAQFHKKIRDAVYGTRPLERAIVKKRTNA